MRGEFLFLGTGASMGIPVIGCNCITCLSPHPFNQRLRTSGLLKVENKSLLIDVGPDFRQQALSHHINRIDGLLLTHTHFDHIGGLDELRILSFIQEGHIPCILSQMSFEELKRRYYYLFQKTAHGDNTTVLLDFFPLEGDDGTLSFLDIPIRYFSYFQGTMHVTGFRWGNFAYVTDIKKYSESIFLHLKGVETLVVSALRKSATKIHFTLEEAILFARRVEAKQVFFTHIAHELEYEEITQKLPEDIHLAYDGLKLDIQWK